MKQKLIPRLNSSWAALLQLTEKLTLPSFSGGFFPLGIMFIMGIGCRDA